ncbi:hypothetical protein K502DRAFT_344629 [Neoconidiobolus thromboides FSU 785]|nr:hypothetical protein K502DRAFT_344629 [Neoconidiobolus thromboides FSU 785]
MDRLPLEIQLIIFSKLEGRDKLNWILTNKSNYNTFVPIIYRKMHIKYSMRKCSFNFKKYGNFINDIYLLDVIDDIGYYQLFFFHLATLFPDKQFNLHCTFDLYEQININSMLLESKDYLTKEINKLRSNFIIKSFKLHYLETDQHVHRMHELFKDVEDKNMLKNVQTLELRTYRNIHKKDSPFDYFSTENIQKMGVQLVKINNVQIIVNEVTKFQNLTSLNLNLLRCGIKIDKLNKINLPNLTTLKLWFSQINPNVDTDSLSSSYSESSSSDDYESLLGSPSSIYDYSTSSFIESGFEFSSEETESTTQNGSEDSGSEEDSEDSESEDEDGESEGISIDDTDNTESDDEDGEESDENEITSSDQNVHRNINMDQDNTATSTPAVTSVQDGNYVNNQNPIEDQVLSSNVADSISALDPSNRGNNTNPTENRVFSPDVAASIFVLDPFNENINNINEGNDVGNESGYQNNYNRQGTQIVKLDGNNFPKLISFELFYDLTVRIELVNPFINLKSLALRISHYQPFTFSMKEYPNLESLKIVRKKSKNSNFNKKTQIIKFDYSKNGIANDKKALSFPKMKQLCIKGFTLDSTTLNFVTKAITPNLITLELEHCNVTKEGAKLLVSSNNLTNIKKLIIDANDDIILEWALISCPNLQYLFSKIGFFQPVSEKLRNIIFLEFEKKNSAYFKYPSVFHTLK